MKIEYADLPLDMVEFEDVSGYIRTSRGCSLRGYKEFCDRVEQLTKRIEATSDNLKIHELYYQDHYFAHLCDRCLILNGIEPEWVNTQILTSLLFVYDGKPGLLIRVNQSNNEGKPGEKGATSEDVIAALWKLTEDLEQAFEVAEKYPWKDVGGVMDAAAKLGKDDAPPSKPEAKAPKSQAELQREIANFSNLITGINAQQAANASAKPNG